MSDILYRAKEVLALPFETQDPIGNLIKASLLPGMIAEIERLQAETVKGNALVDDLRSRAQNAEGQLRAIIYDDELPEWTKDYHLLNSALEGEIVEAARKWHQAYRRAQNSNLVRKRQNEQQAAYVARLEAAYLQAYAASVKLDLFDPSWQTPGEKALGSLEKIKRGGP